MHHSLVEGSQQTDDIIPFPHRQHRQPSTITLGSPRFILLANHFPALRPIIIKQTQQGSIKQIKNTSYTNRYHVKTMTIDQIQLTQEEKQLKERNKKLLLRKNMTRKLLKITDYLASYRKC